MAAMISCNYFSSLSNTSKLISLKNPSFHRRCSSENPRRIQLCNKLKDRLLPLKECAISIALAVGLITGAPTLGWSGYADAATTPVLPDLSVLISGPPIKDPGALLRYALPIDNKAIREVQKPLEDITDSLKIAGVRGLDSVERNVKQASRTLKQVKSLIVSGLAESKKDHGIELLNKLEAGMGEFQKIVEERNRDAVAPKQKELLNYVGGVEEDMVAGFPYEVPEEYQNIPLLKGRAAVDMKVKFKDNPNLEECVFHIVLDGYNAPVTAGNFIDLVERHFYDGMEIQRADGFVVQTGDPEGPAEGFIDPSTEKTRTIPLEIMVEGEKVPFYGETLEFFKMASSSSQNNFDLNVVPDAQPEIWSPSFLSQNEKLLASRTDAEAINDSMAFGIQDASSISNMARRLHVRGNEVQALKVQVLKLQQKNKDLQWENKELKKLVDSYANDLGKRYTEVEMNTNRLREQHESLLLEVQKSLKISRPRT